jgi:hypothetical protein
MSSLQEKLREEQRNKFDETNRLERRLLEALENERKATVELAEVKNDRQKRY